LAYQDCAATVFWSYSDRKRKEKFEAIEPQTILEKVCALPVSTWNFKGRRDRHLGPMAQDFREAFHLGIDDERISSIDEDGVALAAIQGLNQKLESQNQNLRATLNEKDTELARLQKEVAEVRAGQQQASEQWEARFDSLSKLVTKITTQAAAPPGNVTGNNNRGTSQTENARP
jgi:hypothetical protein